MKGVYINRKFGLPVSARMIFQDKLFLDWIEKNKYPMIILISQNKVDVPNSANISSKKTANIDLKKDIKEILSNFNSTTRNEVRRTFKMDDLEFRREDRIDKKIYKIYKNFRKDKKLSLRDRKFLESASLYVAYYKGEPISFVTVYDVRPSLRIQNIFSDISKESDSELKKIIGYSTRRLIYEIAKFGSENGYNFLDMAGVNLDDPKKQGITKFKMGFGGELVDEYTYTYKRPFLRKMSLFKNKFK